MFRPTVSLPDGSCPMSVAAREPEIQLAIDRSSPSPAQQTYNDLFLKSFSRLLDMFYLQALAIG